MAALASPHWHALTSQTRDNLAVLASIPMMRAFYLAGGTGLALRLGHRISVDLGLFANMETLDDRLRHSITAALEQEHEVERLQDSVLGLVLNVDGQPCSFFSYGFPLLAPADQVSGLQVASILDIGLMKLDAIAAGARARTSMIFSSSQPTSPWMSYSPAAATSIPIRATLGCGFSPPW
jgi:hypothetical protein